MARDGGVGDPSDPCERRDAVPRSAEVTDSETEEVPAAVRQRRPVIGEYRHDPQRQTIFLNCLIPSRWVPRALAMFHICFALDCVL